ncbi:unnamed protein product [Closterium sp. NIES-53]
MRHASLHPLVPFRLTPFGLAFAFPPRGCSAGVWSPASSSSVRLRARLPFLPLPALADTSPPLRAPALSAASSAHAGSSTRPCMPSTGLPHGSSPTTSTAAPPSAPPSSPAPLPSSASFLCSLLVRSRPGSLHLLPPFTLPPPVQDFSQPWGGAAVSSTLLRLPLLAATAAARVMVSMPSLAILARLPGFTRPVGTPAVPGPVEVRACGGGGEGRAPGPGVPLDQARRRACGLAACGFAGLHTGGACYRLCCLFR